MNDITLERSSDIPANSEGISEIESLSFDDIVDLFVKEDLVSQEVVDKFSVEYDDAVAKYSKLAEVSNTAPPPPIIYLSEDNEIEVLPLFSLQINHIDIDDIRIVDTASGLEMRDMSYSITVSTTHATQFFF